MQTQTINDADGITRRYGFDDYSGALYVRDDASFSQNPGRPYRPIYAAKRADIRALGGAHAELWCDPVSALRRIKDVSPAIGWRSAN